MNIHELPMGYFSSDMYQSFVTEDEKKAIAKSVNDPQPIVRPAEYVPAPRPCLETTPAIPIQLGALASQELLSAVA